MWSSSTTYLNLTAASFVEADPNIWGAPWRSPTHIGDWLISESLLLAKGVSRQEAMAYDNLCFLEYILVSLLSLPEEETTEKTHISEHQCLNRLRTNS